MRQNWQTFRFSTPVPQGVGSISPCDPSYRRACIETYAGSNPASATDSVPHGHCSKKKDGFTMASSGMIWPGKIEEGER